MNSTVQTQYYFQYLTMKLIGYMNDPTEPAFFAFHHGMDFLMHHPHGTIMYSSKNIFKVNESPLQYFLKLGKADINQTWQY